MAHELATVDAEIGRLAEVAAASGYVAAIAEALKTPEARRAALQARTGQGGATGPADRMARRLWRSLLRRNVTEARVLLEAVRSSNSAQ